MRLIETESFPTQREPSTFERKLSVEEMGTARSKDSFLTKPGETFDPDESVSDILKKFREEQDKIVGDGLKSTQTLKEVPLKDNSHLKESSQTSKVFEEYLDMFENYVS